MPRDQRELDEDELRELKETKDEVPRGWRPDPETIRAIWGEPMESGKVSEELPSVTDTGNSLGITWAEKKAILARLDAGQPITPKDWQRLQQPISDLQTGTLAQDEAWLRRLLESERYAEIMRDSREAQDLKEALLAALKAINYWRSKP